MGLCKTMVHSAQESDTACSYLKVFTSNTQCKGEPDAEYSHPVGRTSQSGCEISQHLSHSKYCSIDGLHEKYYSRDNCDGEHNDDEELVFQPNGCISNEKSGTSFFY